MLIVDEIQSGFGRTGKLFCFEHANILPDILVMAKGLGSGLPISGIASTAEIMNKWTPGTHGGTYCGGSTITAVAACATLDVLFEEGFLQNVVDRGNQLIAGLKRLQSIYPFIGDVRGLGLMVATEFSNPDKSANAKITAQILEKCLEKKLLLLVCGTYKNIIRWIPALVVNEQQLEDALLVFESVLSEVSLIE